MVMPDTEFDALIKAALQQQNVTSQQKQIAWERLSVAVTQQEMLPPLEVIDNLSFAERASLTSGAMWRWFCTFLSDEDLYERARRSRYAVRYYGLPHSGELSFQMIEPLRLTVSDPIF